MSPYWTVQLPNRAASVHLRSSASLVFSYRGVQAARHVGYVGDEAKRRPYISSNGARLFDDTVAARSLAERATTGNRSGEDLVGERLYVVVLRRRYCMYGTSAAAKHDKKFSCRRRDIRRRFISY